MRLSKRIVSLVLSIFMIVGLWSSSTALVEAKEIDLAETATQNRTAYYNTNYTLTGNQVEDLIAVAEAQLGKTKANLGYTEAWCANFVSDCADLAGLSNIIPRSGGVRYLRENILNAGGYEVSQPQRGDIICYYCNTCLGIDGKPWAHVGIMLDSTYSIEGNRGGQVKKASGAFYDEYNHSNITKKYVRPAYTNSQVTPTDWDNPDSYPFPTRDIYYRSSNTMTGSDVKWVQAVLRKLGYSIDIDGSFGPASAAVVKQFQSDSGLEVDGSVGPITRQTLYDLWQRIKNPYIDVGTNFYAYIINTQAWKMLTNDNGNVALFSETGNSNQVWWFERQSDGSYAIINTWDQNVLDNHNFGQTNGTNVQVCQSNGSSAQRWFIYGESGAYSLRASCGDLRLDVNGGSTEDGTNIQMWENNDTPAQKFQIWKLNKAGASHLTVHPGTSTTSTVFVWWQTADTTRYNIKIWNGTYWVGDPYRVIWGETGNTCSIILPAGYYEAYVDSENNYSCTMSDNVVQFMIEEGITEPPTEMPTNAPTEPPTEVPTEAPTEPVKEEPTVPPTEPTDDIDTGTTGNCNWSFNKTTGHLRIYGNGNTGDYTTRSSVPWYQYRTEIKTVAIEDGVEYIGGMAFMSCSNIERVTLAESVTHIGRRAFMSCSSLSEISPLTQIKVIDERAFLYCSELKSIALSDNIDYIGDSAFSYTGWSENHPDGPAYFGKILYKCFGQCPDEVEIKEGTKSISEYAFINRITLKRIKLPNTLTVISKRAFIGCSSLETIDIPDSVTSIEEFAFRGCSSLKTATIPSSVTSIGNSVFENTAEDLIIYGYKDSVAETYANDNEIVFIDINNPPTEPTTEYILGDADGDGVVTILDATVIQRYLAAYTVKNPDTVVRCGDITGDGLDIIDATLIQRFLAEFTVPYDIGQPTHR